MDNSAACHPVLSWWEHYHVVQDYVFFYASLTYFVADLHIRRSRPYPPPGDPRGSGRLPHNQIGGTVPQEIVTITRSEKVCRGDMMLFSMIVRLSSCVRVLVHYLVHYSVHKSLSTVLYFVCVRLMCLSSYPLLSIFGSLATVLNVYVFSSAVLLVYLFSGTKGGQASGGAGRHSQRLIPVHVHLFPGGSRQTVYGRAAM